MKHEFWLDGIKIRPTKNGTEFATFYVRDFDSNGNPEMEQISFNSFSPEIIAVAKKFESGQTITLDLRVKDAFVEDLEA